MESFAFIAMLVVSLIVQLAAAAVAIATSRAWKPGVPLVVLPAALALMTFRRFMSLADAVATASNPAVFAWAEEISAFVISLFMLFATICLRRAAGYVGEEMKAKDLVLKESLHTTKNNLQSLASLIRVEAGFATSEEHRALIRELEQRVMVYATLQQQLFYGEGNLNVTEYLHEIVTSVAEGYAPQDDSADIRTDLASFDASPRELLYAGLIVSEALINAHKHARRSSAPLMIQVVSGIAGDVRYVEVRDNGPGFPRDDGAPPTDGFGTTFLKSLNSGEWSVRLFNDGGAVVRAEF